MQYQIIFSFLSNIPKPFLFFRANRYGRAFKEFYDLPDHPGRHCGKGKAHEYGEHLLTPVAVEQ